MPPNLVYALSRDVQLPQRSESVEKVCLRASVRHCFARGYDRHLPVTPSPCVSSLSCTSMPLKIYLHIYLTNLNRRTKLRQKRVAFAVTNKRIRGYVSDGGKLLYARASATLRESSRSITLHCRRYVVHRGHRTPGTTVLATVDCLLTCLPPPRDPTIS